MEFGWSATGLDYRAALREFVNQEVPGWRETPVHRRVITPEDKARVTGFTAKLAQRGWLTANWPKEFGGEVFWCQGFPEPEAGSDPASLQTRAVGDGDGYVVDEQKTRTSHTPSAEWIFLLVRMGPDAPKNHGISILLVPLDTPGIDIRRIPDIVGERRVRRGVPSPT
jgi:alkylation response protein AidB-like acyl-CoA dehydrogenase